MYARGVKQATSTVTAWSKNITDILFVYNSKASNYQRSVKWIEAIAQRLDITPQRIDAVKEALVLEQTVVKLCQTKRTVLVAIAGGDGTVSAVANKLIQIVPATASGKGRLFLLPLWGGNANDMACMLNGLSSAMSMPHLMAKAKPIMAPLIRIQFSSANHTVPSGRTTGLDHERTVYACCYASFGASAYAARQLDNRGYAKRKFIQYLPPVIAVRELSTVVKAMLGAPSFRAKFGSTEAKLYEHTLVNGPRLAKVSRIPVGLTDPLFFHAVVTKKDPSIIIELLRVATRRRSPIYATKSQHSFMVYDRIDAQIDGEVYQLEPGTQVTASIFWPPFAWVGTKVANRATRTRIR